MHVHAKYSNLISGQKGGATYKPDIDEEGAMWIKIEKAGKGGIVGVRKTSGQESAMELHERYGHISYDTLRTLPELPKEIEKNACCEACEKDKATKPPAKQSSKLIRTSRLLERLHADLVGPINPKHQAHNTDISSQ